jgi:hypothetical protein
VDTELKTHQPTVLGVDPGVNHMALAWVGLDDGLLQRAELRPVKHLPGTPKYWMAAATVTEDDCKLPCMYAFVERAGVHGIQKRGKRIAKTERRGDVTYNWTAIEDLIGIAERLCGRLPFHPAYVLPRPASKVFQTAGGSWAIEGLHGCFDSKKAAQKAAKDAVPWQLRSWCGRTPKLERHLRLSQDTTPAEQELARQAAPKSLLHNVLDAWCIARWAQENLL